MSNTARHYEQIGDKLKGDQATRAYRAAQNHLNPTDASYMDDVKRLQAKIIDSLGGGANG